LFAQSSVYSNSPAADREWKGIEARGLPEAGRLPARGESRTPQQRAQDQNAIRAHFLATAVKAMSFREKHPRHEKVSEARLLEAKSRLRAALLGDESQQARIQSLVGQVKGDTSLAGKDRFEVVAMAEHLLIREVAGNREEAAIARENSARYLIKEFPDEAGGYTALLAVAEATGDRASIRNAAKEVIHGAAPFAARARAQVLLDRDDLIGKSLADVANTALGRDNFFEQCRGRRVLLYTWSSEVPQSIAYAVKVVAGTPEDWLVIGFNLDRDVADAQALAGEMALPGQQYFNDSGIGSWLALLLKLNHAPLVYVTDEQGIIRDVGAQRGVLAERLASLTER
jgi:hypothetical protein